MRFASGWFARGVVVLGLSGSVMGQSFVNWETPHVSPIAMTPDGTKLLVCNLADNRLEVFSLTSGSPVAVGAVPVGLDPCSVRARTNTEAWVVNHISDSVSIVDLTTLNVTATLDTADEPCDVVFAGAPERAFVSCSQANTVQVFDPASLGTAPTNIAIDGEDPRAMAVSTDGSEVYVAIFESGNATTILGGGAVSNLGFPPNVVDDGDGPHGGTNPPPNDGLNFDPPINGALPTPPEVGLIVRKDANGDWFDDNGGDWTAKVSGADAGDSGRPVGWDLPDHDVAIIQTSGLTVSYATRLMNICMAIGVNPVSDEVTVVGTEATNEIRFEPIVKARFTRVNIGIVDPSGPTTTSVVDLNQDHLTYSDAQITAQSDTGTASQALRDMSIGDPRGIVWNSAGTKAYVSGMGSNNLVVIDGNGDRAGLADTIEVGEGPTGVALDETRNQLYVVNKFAGSISVVSTTTELETSQVSFFDPSPTAITTGRKHLYDTHKNSALGQLACASCHVDARMDRLAWDLGDPSGSMKTFNQNCLAGVDTGCEDWHPMKGPMTTQTLQDIIGQEPLHWRGDRDGIEEFNGAFLGLQGDDVNLTVPEMQEFEDFLATIHFPPNPFREFDNSLPTNLPLTGHFSDGRFSGGGGLAAGAQLPNGNAQDGLDIYRPPRQLDGSFACVTCHTLPTGMGTDTVVTGGGLVDIPVGPNGEHHLSLVSVDGSTNVSIKVPQTRALYDKVGFEATKTSNRSGFGVLHDGSVDSIARFVSEPVFSMANDQEVADMVAFMLTFSGSDLPDGNRTLGTLEPVGTPSQDAHAAVGKQETINSGGANSLIDDMITEADKAGPKPRGVDLVVKGVFSGENRGWVYNSVSGDFDSDRSGESHTLGQLKTGAGVGSELTFTVVPRGSGTRIGIDRDEDGHFDTDETDACSDPADAGSVPGAGCPTTVPADCDEDGDVDGVDFSVFASCFNKAGNPPRTLGCSGAQGTKLDFDNDGDVDGVDFSKFASCFNKAGNPPRTLGCPQS